MKTRGSGTPDKPVSAGCGKKMRIGRHPGLLRSLAPVISRPSGVEEVENPYVIRACRELPYIYPRDSGCEIISDYLW